MARLIAAEFRKLLSTRLWLWLLLASMAWGRVLRAGHRGQPDPARADRGRAARAVRDRCRGCRAAGRHLVTGAGLGALLGGEVSAVAGLLLYLYVAEPLISRITALDPVTAYLPGVAADGLTQANQAGVRLLAPSQGGLVFAAWAAILASAGAAAVSRRDIT